MVTGRGISALAYRGVIASGGACGVLGAAFGLAGAFVGGTRLVAVAVAFIGLGVTLGLFALHLHLRELLRVVMPAVGRAAGQPVAVVPAAPAAPDAASEQQLLAAVNDLTQAVRLSRNNELHLLDALRRLEQPAKNV